MTQIKDERGSVTVEMAFIFPIVFFVLLAIIYMGFYMLDRVRVQAEIDACALEQSVAMKEQVALGQTLKDRDFSKHQLFSFWTKGTSQEDALKAYTEERLEKALCMGKLKKLSVSISSMEIKIDAKVEMNIGISHVKEYFTGTPLSYSLHSIQQINNSSEFVRIYEAINEIIDGDSKNENVDKQIKGIEALK